MSATEVGGPDPDLEAKLAEAATILREYARGTATAEFCEKLRGLADAVDEAGKRVKLALSPGWICGACGVFNGDAKERLSACRSCGMARR
jgi:hypothetical protein